MRKLKNYLERRFVEECLCKEEIELSKSLPMPLHVIELGLPISVQINPSLGGLDLRLFMLSIHAQFSIVYNYSNNFSIIKY